jgi:hypothetical protein
VCCLLQANDPPNPTANDADIMQDTHMSEMAAEVIDEAHLEVCTCITMSSASLHLFCCN